MKFNSSDDQLSTLNRSDDGNEQKSKHGQVEKRERKRKRGRERETTSKCKDR